MTRYDSKQDIGKFLRYKMLQLFESERCRACVRQSGYDTDRTDRSAPVPMHRDRYLLPPLRHPQSGLAHHLSVVILTAGDVIFQTTISRTHDTRGRYSNNACIPG